MTELKLTNGARNFFENPPPSYVGRHEDNEVLHDLSLGVLNPGDPNSRYSDPNFTRLKGAISSLFGKSPEMISLGTGIDGILESIPQIFQGDIVITSPDFPRFVEIGMRHDREIRTVHRNLSDEFSFNDSTIEDILNEMDNGQKIVMLSTPNNPTGHLIPIESLYKLSQKANEGHLLVLDLAYGEFAGLDYVREVVDMASKSRNTIALLTCSKARGIAGIARVGYGISNPSIAGAIEKWRLPFVVSGENEAIDSIKNTNALSDVISDVDEKRSYIESIVDANPKLNMINNGKTNTILVRGIGLDVADYLHKKGIKSSAHDWLKDSNGTGLGYTRVTLGNWNAVRCLGNALEQL